MGSRLRLFITASVAFAVVFSVVGRPPWWVIPAVAATAAALVLVAGRRARTVAVSRRVSVPAAPDVVWALVTDPRRVTSCVPGYLGGHVVAGTGNGVGQRQVGLREDGSSVVCEVTVSEPCRRLELALVEPAPGHPMRTVYELAPEPTGCSVTLRVEVDLPAGQLARPSWHRAQRAVLREMARRLPQAVGGPLRERAG